jgi:hypothetical protein
MKRAFLPFVVCFLVAVFMLQALPVRAQSSNTTLDAESLKEQAPKVFLDCHGCDRDFFREEIPYVNYVRDRKGADVHVLVTEQDTGSGGQEYTFAFIGLGEYEGMNFDLVYASGPADMRDETRKGQVEIMKRGLFPYLLNSPICELITLDFQNSVEIKPTSMKDPWNYWVFSVELDGRFQSELSQSESSLDANLSINRATPEFKFRLGLSGDFEEERFDYEGESLTSSRQEKNLATMAVKSISEHWSVGGWVEAESNTYNNMDLYVTVAPAIEFNLFPYAESTRRQLRFLYKLGFNRANYSEETIYDKTEELLFDQSLTANLEIREPWGSASTSLEGSHYFHDFNKYRIVLRGSVSFRVIKGLSLSVRGRYERISDQFSLPKGDASFDEVLLRRRELATNYEFSFSVGLRYTFGSVYSNVVNPRMEGIRYRGYN